MPARLEETPRAAPVAEERISLPRRLRSFWTTHQAVDVPIGLLLGFLVHHFAVPLTALPHRDPSIRFTGYAAASAGYLAVVAIGFTPLAIMVTLGHGAQVTRLRRHGRSLHRQYLRGVLVLLTAAGATVGAGLADAGSVADPQAELVASLFAGWAMVTTLRLLWIFMAILAADATDQAK